MAFICAMTLTSCDEIMSKMDNPVDSYLKVDAEVFVKEGSAVELYAETISDAEVTYTVGDEKIAKVEKVSNHEVKVIGVKPGETVINVKLAANAYYKAGEAKVKVVVTPAVTLKDAVVDGAKLKIGYKFNGEDYIFAYEFDASEKVFNALDENNVPEAITNLYDITITYDGDGKITQKLVSKADENVVPFVLNLYTAGSFDRIYKLPIELKSVVVNNYDVLPYTEESVTPIADLQAAGLPDEMSTGTKGSFAVTDVTPKNATNQVIKYSSSNTAVMTIDANGNFEAVGAGEATLKAEATDGSGKFVEHNVTVTDTPKYLKWDNTKKELVATPFPATYNTVQNSNENVNWAAGTYVVEGEITIGGTINLTGNVNLIIKDGAKLTVTNQIVGYDKNLSIYGQANQTGQLVVNYSGQAITNINTLEVHSAKVKATSSANSYSGFYYIQTFNVYGGSVDAESTAATSGYGISLASSGSMNIYGGDVKALGKGNKFGIRGSDSTITVYGGKLWAECAGNKAISGDATLTKGEGFTGQIYTSSNGSSWDVYTGTATPTTKYVLVDK